MRYCDRDINYLLISLGEIIRVRSKFQASNGNVSNHPQNLKLKSSSCHACYHNKILTDTSSIHKPSLIISSILYFDYLQKSI